MSEKVQHMFASISGKYDLMNSVFTLGMHHLWRKRAVRYSHVQKGAVVLDCASGTGDLALEFKKVVGAEGRVIATDFCQEMLDYIAPKAAEKNLPIEVAWADVMNLAYTDNSFDAVSISYGIRNVDNPLVALSEMVRVLKPGGRLVIVETGQPKGVFRYVNSFYGQYVLPLLGRMIAGNSSAYTYLPKTAANFPSGDEFVALVQSLGTVGSVYAYPQFFGVTYIYTATKGV